MTEGFADFRALLDVIYDRGRDIKATECLRLLRMADKYECQSVVQACR